MNYLKPLRFLFCAILAVGFSTGAFAQATRTWVSGVGDDVNPCSRTAPCKTFAGAISKTAEGGEIDALDPAGYGTLTINKAMTVDGGTGSGWASVLNSSTSGFTVNITTGTHVNDAVVILRNITVNGASQSPSAAGLRGINYLKAARVYVEYCRFENQSTSGITVNTTTGGFLFVRDSDFDNVNTAITATATGTAAVVDAKNISANGNTNGVVFVSNISGTVIDSFFSRNLGGAGAQAGNACVMNLTNCHFISNATAINAQAGSQIRLSENEIFDNSTGLAGLAASFQSGGNNKLAGNGASLAPTGPALINQ